MSARHLTKRFGGLVAVSDVTLDLWRNRIHAVIGPNGAGKSTLTALLAGDLAPTSGEVLLESRNVTGWSPNKLARDGLGRSFQKTNIFPVFTVWENARLAAQSRDPHIWHWFTGAASLKAVNERAADALELAGLLHRRDVQADAISHGEQRQLEIAMALATSPKVLLLDEPLAGMGAAEAEKMVALLTRLKQNHALLLIEHDMDAVFALADQLTVMVNGKVIATGSASEIRNHAEVRAAYLGEEQ